MTAPDRTQGRGTVYTFYSFKGGVGRTMALANVAALLARWGHSVLVVDWDLEAPGLERFFATVKPGIPEARVKTPGILDLIQPGRNRARLSWHDCLIEIGPIDGGSKLSLITAGQNSDDYTERLHSINFNELFKKQDLGSYIESLRNEWISEFEFVLIDSRTGFTNIGGICTVHLADVLVLFFTTTESSVSGALSVVERARSAQERLPLDRGRLLAVPVPARDESRTEYLRAAGWKREFAKRFSDLYRDWLPSGVEPEDAIDLLRVPYVPYWSFGERLPAIEESTKDPSTLGRAYDVLARLLGARLDWRTALRGEIPAPSVFPRRSFNQEWLERHRGAAERGLAASGQKGFMEIFHYSPDSSISISQGDLLIASRRAQVNEGRSLIGTVLNDAPGSPKAMNDGIVASFSGFQSFVYWALAKNGDFYSLMSLQEDGLEPGDKAISLDGRILRTAEALLHCARLYEELGVPPDSHVEISIRYGGLQGRMLTSSQRFLAFTNGAQSLENTVSTSVVSTVREIDSQIVDLTRSLCEPIFVLFGFASFKREIYDIILSGFIPHRLA